jgi:undecaprenyl-diphosphatase
MKIRLQILIFAFLASMISTENVRGETSAVKVSQSQTSSSLTPVQAIILGVVEGATEYLPVSSTGHLVIVQHLMGMSGDEQKKAAADSLAICIQIGAIFAVIVLYFNRIKQMITGMSGRDKEGFRLLVNLIIAFLPVAIIGLLFNKLLKKHLLHVLPVAVALFVGGVLILLQSFLSKKSDEETGKDLTQMSWKDALFVGVLQCFALWPGFSRSLATILACRWANVRMMSAVEFSFLLGLVTLSAATVYEGLKHGKEMIAEYGVTMPILALITAFVAAVISVKLMVTALNKYGLTPFGYYRILLAIVCLWWL